MSYVSHTYTIPAGEQVKVTVQARTVICTDSSQERFGLSINDAGGGDFWDGMQYKSDAGNLINNVVIKNYSNSETLEVVLYFSMGDVQDNSLSISGTLDVVSTNGSILTSGKTNVDATGVELFAFNAKRKAIRLQADGGAILWGESLANCHNKIDSGAVEWIEIGSTQLCVKAETGTVDVRHATVEVS